jgi:pyrroline-5-carboxylate reductase
MKVDAIVNTTNEEMIGYSGVDLAVHEGAGPKLDRECERIAPLGLGCAKITRGYNLAAKYIRIMPNTPAKICEGMTALCCGEDVCQERICEVTSLLEAAGKVEKVDEKLMDCVTAVSGSGPAYAFMFIEAMADAAVKFGMPRKQAYIYAAQTLKGAASMVLQEEQNPAALKDAVCSPAGTTIEAVAALEKYGFRNAVIEAVTAAHDKSVAMGKK